MILQAFGPAANDRMGRSQVSLAREEFQSLVRMTRRTMTFVAVAVAAAVGAARAAEPDGDWSGACIGALAGYAWADPDCTITGVIEHKADVDLTASSVRLGLSYHF